MNFLLFIFLCFIYSQVNNAEDFNVVHTSDGPIKGKILETVSKHVKYLSFQGIPYAEPPKRFRPPVKVNNWTEIKDATKEGEICIQYDNKQKTVIGNENCLFLNAHVPQLDLEKCDTKKAVMVWIHGGSFSQGSGNIDSFNPSFFIDNGVIVVTLNYRLGPFGFLTLDHPKVLGNAGLKDQNLALRWVQNNIHKFCGDPEKVTLFGQSAGGASVDYHVLSEKSKGLFQRSISMSSSPYCGWTFTKRKNAEKTARDLGKSLNGGENVENDEELLSILKNAPASEIIKKAKKISTSLPLFTPVLENTDIQSPDEKFLTECHEEKYSTGNYNQMPHMMGFTHDEALLFAASVDDLIKHQTTKLSGIFNSVSLSDIAAKGILTKILDGFKSTSVKALEDIITLLTDVMFKACIDLKHKRMAATKNHSIYYYHFTFDAKESSFHYVYENITELNGVAHEDDLSFIFYRPAKNMSLYPYSEYQKLSQEMVEMWANFAKYGNPTPPQKIQNLENILWPISGEDGSHLEIGSKLTVSKESPIDEETRLFQKIEEATASEQSDCKEKSLFSLENIKNSVENLLP